jgi:two-component system NtrC family sensor kinase
MTGARRVRVSSVRAWIARLFGSRMQVVLIASFSLVAALTIGLNTLVTFTQVINKYLISAQDERVARDMDLAEAFYELKLEEIIAVGHRMTQDPRVIENLRPAFTGQQNAFRIIDQEISRKITVPTLGGTHLLAILDAQGKIIDARVLDTRGALSTNIVQGDWNSLPIVTTVLSTGEEQSGTEVIPAQLLAQVGLDKQALIPLKETPRAAEKPFDPREGTAGLAIVGGFPMRDAEGRLIGALIISYLFNNDFILVDRIKEVAGVDTVTIFFGDLRVSTNVMTADGDRAVGTRVSQAVFDQVLVHGQDYKGEAFVVNENFITRYVPLRDHQGNVVGMLYVGARLSSFELLVRSFYHQEAIIALVCIVLAGVVSVPIAKMITRPIADLAKANRKLANGDMTVRVEAQGKGELATLGRSFNSMVETLDRTQQELMHKEKLASMGQLAAGVAHEINNPLGTILLFSEIMCKEGQEDDPRRDDLEMIIRETRRCKIIVADLLNFARQQEVLAKDTNVHGLLDQVIEGMEHHASFQKVTIMRDYSADLPTIQADPGQLQQVFVNLIQNAAEAIEGGGTIQIRTRPVDEGHVEIQISDDGCGIAEENLGKLFTPFFTTKRQGKGTGLGLSIAYGIIKMHKGQITVKSQVGQGTAFTITLPIQLFLGENRKRQLSPDLIG